MLVRLPAASAAIALLCLAPAVSAQAPAAAAAPAVYVPTSLAAEPGLARTPDGHPDFQDAIWATNYFPVFETSPMNPNLVVSEEEATKMKEMMVAGMKRIPDFNIDPEAGDIIGNSDGLPVVRGQRRTRLIVLPADGKLPIKPEIRKQIAGVDTLGGGLDSYEDRPSGERCLVLGGNPPVYAIIAYNRLRFVQTPDYVVIHHENGDEARIIPFTGAPNPPGGPTSWFGDATARWDGDTLVIETIRQKASQRVRGLMSKFVVEADSKVIERFTRVSKNELLYQFTVEDPDVYTAPWLAEFSFHAVTTGMFPSACHEHNYSLPNILTARVVADERTAKPTPKPKQ